MGVIVLFALMLIIGCSIGDWSLIFVGGCPIFMGILAFFLQHYSDKKLEEELKRDPEKARRVEEIMKKYR